MAVNNRQIAENILAAVGGRENITSVTHCMTRLRFNLKDESKADTEAIKAIPGVVGVMRKSGQYQIIIGTDVAQVMNEVNKLGKITGGESGGSFRPVGERPSSRSSSTSSKREPVVSPAR